MNRANSTLKCFRGLSLAVLDFSILYIFLDSTVWAGETVRKDENHALQAARLVGGFQRSDSESGKVRRSQLYAAGLERTRQIVVTSKGSIQALKFLPQDKKATVTYIGIARR